MSIIANTKEFVKYPQGGDSATSPISTPLYTDFWFVLPLDAVDNSICPLS